MKLKHTKKGLGLGGVLALVLELGLWLGLGLWLVKYIGSGGNCPCMEGILIIILDSVLHEHKLFFKIMGEFEQ